MERLPQTNDGEGALVAVIFTFVFLIQAMVFALPCLDADKALSEIEVTVKIAGGERTA
jgi:hypothetical protein